MDLAELRIFKAVADHGGVIKAAAVLHRVQSNVTTRLRQLEERLGAKLFHRTGRRLVLSAEGRILLAYADRLLRLSSEAQAALNGNVPQGLLRIGALESTAAARLPPVLSRFHARHPAVRLELVTGTSGNLVARVVSEEIEAAVVAEPFPAGGLESEHVFTERLVLITPKSFAGPVRSARDIAGATVLAFAMGCSYRRRLETWLGRSKVMPHRVMEYGSYHAIVACTAAGSGIAVVPESVLGALGAREQVRAHPLPANIAVARTLLVWRRGHQSTALAALREALRGAKPRRGRDVP